MKSSADFAPRQFKLPDRKEITLCEAVTAFVFGKANNMVHEMLDGEATNEENSAKAQRTLLNGCIVPPMLGASNFVA
jgi:hypothetical protein